MIKCYFNGEFSYIITIGNDAFEMSSNANQPNGVNSFIGNADEINLEGFELIQMGDLPKGVLIGITERLRQRRF